MPHLLLAIYVHTLTAQLAATDRITAHHTEANERRSVGDRGQATTEYALVLLAAAMVALLVIAWASAGGGAARISRLFNRVIDAVIDRV
jgi:hypothetical protein